MSLQRFLRLELREVEEVEQVADRGTVHRHIRTAGSRNRIREIVPATVGDLRQIPITLNELDNRHMVRVFVRDVSLFRVGRDNDQRNARAVAEKVERLHVTGVVVAAAFIKGNKNSGVRGVSRLLQYVDDLFGEALEQIEFGR